MFFSLGWEVRSSVVDYVHFYIDESASQLNRNKVRVFCLGPVAAWTKSLHRPTFIAGDTPSIRMVPASL